MAQNEDFDFAKSVNEKAIDSSNVVMRSLLAINGGSAVALLAFMGSLAGRSEIDFSAVIVALSYPLLLLGWGVAVCVVAMIFAYFTNYTTVGHAFAQAGSIEVRIYGILKTICHLFAVAAVLGSLALFVWAIYEVRNAIILIA